MFAQGQQRSQHVFGATMPPPARQTNNRNTTRKGLVPSGSVPRPPQHGRTPMATSHRNVNTVFAPSPLAISSVPGPECEASSGCTFTPADILLMELGMSMAMINNETPLPTVLENNNMSGGYTFTQEDLQQMMNVEMTYVQAVLPFETRSSAFTTHSVTPNHRLAAVRQEVKVPHSLLGKHPRAHDEQHDQGGDPGLPTKRLRALNFREPIHIPAQGGCQSDNVGLLPQKGLLAAPVVQSQRRVASVASWGKPRGGGKGGPAAKSRRQPASQTLGWSVQSPICIDLDNDAPKNRTRVNAFAQQPEQKHPSSMSVDKEGNISMGAISSILQRSVKSYTSITPDSRTSSTVQEASHSSIEQPIQTPTITMGDACTRHPTGRAVGPREGPVPATVAYEKQTQQPKEPGHRSSGRSPKATQRRRPNNADRELHKKAQRFGVLLEWVENDWIPKVHMDAFLGFEFMAQQCAQKKPGQKSDKVSDTLSAAPMTTVQQHGSATELLFITPSIRPLQQHPKNNNNNENISCIDLEAHINQGMQTIAGASFDAKYQHQIECLETISPIHIKNSQQQSVSHRTTVWTKAQMLPIKEPDEVWRAPDPPAFVTEEAAEVVWLLKIFKEGTRGWKRREGEWVREWKVCA